LAHGLKGQKEQDEVSTVAITGVDGAGNLAAGANAETLCRSFTAIQEGKALVVTPAAIAKRFGDPWTSHHGHVAPALWRRRVASWLAEREERHRFVVLECFDREDEEDDVVPTRAFARAWARLALAQSDVALVVADAARSSAVAPRRLERRALYGGSELTRKKSIVLLVHDRNAPPPKRSSRWLAARPAPTQGCAPRLLHCVRNDSNDLGRVARIVAGRAVGVVLGGGGGRGLGHLGVLRALEEGGLMPDVVAGCSQGAYCAAAYALPQRNDDRLEATSVASEEIARTLTSPPSLAWELTLPLLSVFSGKLFSRAVRRGLSFAWSRPIGRRNDSCLSDESDDDDEALGDARRITRRKVWSRRDVEDCWLPFFCVTTNLTRQQGHSISAGDLVFACRASMSVAELLPPMRCQKTGDLHCDGCYVNNLPVREMRSTGCVRTVVGVSVVDSSGGEFRDVIVYGESGVSGWYLLLRRWLNVLLVCVGRSRDCRKVPSMSKVNATLQVLRNKSQLAEDLEGGTMDLFLEIKPVADFSASCYWRLTRMAGLAADYALPKVRRFVRKRDNLRRKLSASLADRDQASLPALRSALFDSVDRDLDTSSGSRNREPASPRRAVDDLLRRLSSSSLRARHPSDNLRW
jgi:predicted acylesterase/phospholipase RssA